MESYQFLVPCPHPPLKRRITVHADVGENGSLARRILHPMLYARQTPREDPGSAGQGHHKCGVPIEWAFYCIGADSAASRCVTGASDHNLFWPDTKILLDGARK